MAKSFRLEHVPPPTPATRATEGRWQGFMTLAEFRATPKREREAVFVAGKAPICVSCGKAFALDEAGERVGIVAVLDIPLSHGGACLDRTRERFAAGGINLNDAAFTDASPPRLTPEQLARALGREARPWEHKLLEPDAAGVVDEPDDGRLPKPAPDAPVAVQIAYWESVINYTHRGDVEIPKAEAMLARLRSEHQAAEPKLVQPAEPLAPTKKPAKKKTITKRDSAGDIAEVVEYDILLDIDPTTGEPILPDLVREGPTRHDQRSV